MVQEGLWSAWAEIKRSKRIYAISCAIAVGLSCVFSLSIPKVYEARTKLSIESNFFEVKLDEMLLTALTKKNTEYVTNTPENVLRFLSSDAFYDEVGRIRLDIKDKGIKTDFAHYLTDYSSHPWWESLLGEKDPRRYLKSSVRTSITRRTGMITIQVGTQDPAISVVMVDSICQHVQRFVSAYKVKKALQDKAYYHGLLNEAGAAYHKALREYGSFVDSNFDNQTEDYQSKEDELQKLVDEKMQYYSKVAKQYNAASMRVQQDNPSFVEVVKATMPDHAQHPKWIANMMAWLFYALVFTTWYVLFKAQRERRMNR